MTITDRTPKPCHHQQVRHRHGTRVCYVADECRCPACTEANRVEQQQRNRLRLYGQARYIDPAPVREHVDQLRAQGMSARAIAAAAGIDRTVIQGLGQRKRIKRTSGVQIMAVTTASMPDRAVSTPEDSEQARRQLQALVASGWSVARLERRMGYSAGNLGRTLHGLQQLLLVGTVRAASAVYAELSVSRPPEHTRHEQAAATRARNHARDRGWLLPIELDLINDEPDDAGQPVIDQVAIERRMDGDKTIRLTAAERPALVDRWIKTGRSLAECERVTGLNPWRYLAKETAA